MSAPTAVPTPGGPAGRERVPRIAAVECPNCGGSVEQRAFGHAVTIVCGSCGSVLDLRHEHVAILERASRAELRLQPMIPLGTRGVWRGQRYEVIGWQRRGITVEGEVYEWDEFLLFNPYRGFCYLTHYEGHWNDVVTVNGLPDRSTRSGRPVAAHDGRSFKHFQRAQAVTNAVLGEFPWEVRRGDRVDFEDFVAPPFILSREWTPDETTWSLGEYVDGRRVWKAFELKGSPPWRKGVFANQPNARLQAAKRLIAPYLAFMILAVAMTGGRAACAENQTVFNARYTAGRGRQAPFVTDNFVLRGGTSNVAFQIWAPHLNNNWLALDLTLIDATTGRVWDVPAEVSYYSGVEGGESWSEGNRTSDNIIANIPEGEYYLRIEPEAGTRAVEYGLAVVRDPPMMRYLFISVFLLTVPILLVGISAHSFEAKRWAESDYPWSSSEDDE